MLAATVSKPQAEPGEGSLAVSSDVPRWVSQPSGEPALARAGQAAGRMGAGGVMGAPARSLDPRVIRCSVEAEDEYSVYEVDINSRLISVRTLSRNAYVSAAEDRHAELVDGGVHRELSHTLLPGER